MVSWELSQTRAAAQGRSCLPEKFDRSSGRKKVVCVGGRTPISWQLQGQRFQRGYQGPQTFRLSVCRQHGQAAKFPIRIIELALQLSNVLLGNECCGSNILLELVSQACILLQLVLPPFYLYLFWMLPKMDVDTSKCGDVQLWFPFHPKGPPIVGAPEPPKA